MTQLFGISKEKLDKIVADNPPSDSLGSNIYGMIASTIRNALVPIESEKKEERCTKCDGTGKLDTVRSLTITCGACNGTGKEWNRKIFPMYMGTEEELLEGKDPRKEVRACPFCGEPVNTNPKNCKGSGHEKRKEEKDYAEFSTPEDALLCSKVMEMDDEDIFNKLSRYKSALEEIADGANRWGDNEYSEIAREALAEESTKGWVSCSTKYNTVSNTAPQEEKCAYCKKARGNCAMCIDYAQDQQKPQEQKEEEKVTPKTPNSTSLMEEFRAQWASRWFIQHPGGEEIASFFQEKMLAMLERLKMEKHQANYFESIRKGYNLAVKQLNAKIEEEKGRLV